MNNVLIKMTLTPPTTVIPKLPRTATNTYTNNDVSSSMLSSCVVVNDDDVVLLGITTLVDMVVGIDGSIEVVEIIAVELDGSVLVVSTEVVEKEEVCSVMVGVVGSSAVVGVVGSSVVVGVVGSSVVV